MLPQPSIPAEWSYDYYSQPSQAHAQNGNPNTYHSIQQTPQYTQLDGYTAHQLPQQAQMGNGDMHYPVQQPPQEVLLNNYIQYPVQQPPQEALMDGYVQQPFQQLPQQLQDERSNDAYEFNAYPGIDPLYMDLDAENLTLYGDNSQFFLQPPDDGEVNAAGPSVPAPASKYEFVKPLTPNIFARGAKAPTPAPELAPASVPESATASASSRVPARVRPRASSNRRLPTLSVSGNDWRKKINKHPNLPKLQTPGRKSRPGWSRVMF